MRARDIDPGGHAFKKQGTFHILAQVDFHGRTQSLRFGSAIMPSGQQRLSPALRGRDWLQSDALAQGFISGLAGLSKQDEVRAYLAILTQTLEGPLGIEGLKGKQTLGAIQFLPRADGLGGRRGQHICTRADPPNAETVPLRACIRAAFPRPVGKIWVACWRRLPLRPLTA